MEEMQKQLSGQEFNSSTKPSFEQKIGTVPTSKTNNNKGRLVFAQRVNTNQMDTTVTPNNTDVNIERSKNKVRKRAHFIDEVDPSQQLVEIIDVEAYQMDDDDNGEENEEIEDDDEFIDRESFKDDDIEKTGKIAVSDESQCKYCSCIIT